MSNVIPRPRTKKRKWKEKQYVIYEGWRMGKSPKITWVKAGHASTRRGAERIANRMREEYIPTERKKMRYRIVKKKR